MERPRFDPRHSPCDPCVFVHTVGRESQTKHPKCALCGFEAVPYTEEQLQQARHDYLELPKEHTGGHPLKGD